MSGLFSQEFFYLVFAMVFFCHFLGNLVARKKISAFPWMNDTDNSNKAVPGIIALVIAFFSAATFVRQNLIEGIFWGSDYYLDFFISFSCSCYVVYSFLQSIETKCWRRFCDFYNCSGVMGDFKIWF